MPSLYSVIAISFNAFDNFEIPNAGGQAKYSYKYCGLRKETGIQSFEDIEAEIRHTIENMSGEKVQMFRSAMRSLVPEVWENPVLEIQFSRLSAGQKFVISIVSSLVSNLERGSLVLLDEPETHLHPSLTVELLTQVTSSP